MNVCIYLFIYKQKASFPINVAWTISGDIQVIFIIWSKTKQKKRKQKYGINHCKSPTGGGV